MAKKIKEFLIKPAELTKWKAKITKVLSAKEGVFIGDLSSLIYRFYKDKNKKLLKLAKKYPTPFYVFDKKELFKSAVEFKSAFAKYLPDCSYYYAVKSNWHPFILANIVKQGFNLDVSSSRELLLGLAAGAKKMVFSGPGKMSADLALAIKHRDKVIVHLDSFGELRRLGFLAEKQKKQITVGVRIFTRFHGRWSKFGISLSDLTEFWQEAKKYPHLNLAGIQFHISWNKDASTYKDVIKELADYLKKNFKKEDLSAIKFIDVGGGYLPYRITGDYPWGSVQGDLIAKAAEKLGGEPEYIRGYYLTESVTLAEYARGIASAINKYLRPLLPGAHYFTEPGRIICNNAMHLVMRVADVKSTDQIILDGGVNIVGWEGLRYDYTPLINLNNFSKKEKSCRIFGSLCMADDVWGYSCFAKKIVEGDVVVIPNFGAYTFTLAQNFIKKVPKVYVIDF